MIPESPETLGFITGLQTAGYLVAALFFLRFWRRTRDGLFRAFALAFLILAIATPLPLLTGIPSENQAPIYVLRLVGFGLIILAILRKNLGGSR
ncbi:DUF5985 family protein [Phenylobacterium deserti]|uniref:DUF5985 family protein n=1 Tax=Phenylobacterium deserti TaxID=1914756 RepID=UPI00197C2499|nr:DUF5985 family protein [Phenylobacterium deserti]